MCGRLRAAVAGAVVACAFAHAAPARADDAACIAASERAITLRKQGALRDTLQQLAVCADEACPGEVKAECTRRIEDVRAAQPTLILSAKDGAGNDLLDVRVTMDGAPLLASLDGRPLAIDPGAHAFRFEAAGQKPIEKTLVLREGEKDRREAIVIGEPPPAPPVPAVPPAPASSWGPQRTIAVVTGSAGVVGLGVGALFGAFAISAKNREQGDCPSAGCSGYTQAKADYDTATKDATGSTISFIAGGVLVGVGAVLWLTAPAAAPTQPDATRGAIDRPGALRVGLAPSTRGQGLALVGTW
jgi:hypothetical protein